MSHFFSHPIIHTDWGRNRLYQRLLNVHVKLQMNLTPFLPAILHDSRISEPCLYQKHKNKNPPYYRQIHAYWGGTQSVFQKKRPKYLPTALEQTKERMVLNRTGEKVTTGHKVSPATVTATKATSLCHTLGLMLHSENTGWFWNRFSMRWETKTCISLCWQMPCQSVF